MSESPSTPKPGSIDILTAQITVMSCAVESLIANHPEPEKVRESFDQLFGQIQAGMLVRGMTPLGNQLMQQFADKIFSPPSTDEWPHKDQAA